MNNHIIFSSMLASFATGFIFWLLMFVEYIVSMLSRGYLPLDAIVFLVPVLVISTGIGMVFFLPIYIKLAKHNMNAMVIVMPLAILVCLGSVLLITRQYSDVMSYISSIVAAISGVVIFTKLEKRNNGVAE